jgi:hypothetical protein
VKSLVELYACLLDESGRRCGTSTLRDVRYVRRRIEHEGLEFLTLTLPTFAKDFERSLELGGVGSDLFRAFRRRGGLPAFLSGFLRLVFDASSGVLLTEPSVDAIREVRQLTLFLSKIELPCSKERVASAFTSFVETDKEVRTTSEAVPEDAYKAFQRAALVAFGGALSFADTLVYRMDIRPRHGPGSVADRTPSNARWNRLVWTSRLETYMPAGEFLIPNWKYLERYSSISFLNPGEEPPVRVDSVPKTLKAPRVIGIEPVHTQYAQQGLLDILKRSIQADNNARSFLDFSSSEPNRSMARDGSDKGHLATLDLSEASDRVSLRLVRTLFANFPWIRGALEASRSERAKVPGHGIISLAKFASMGSAVCFPVEAFVFATIALMGHADACGTPFSTRFVKSARGQVRVYGDDIIVPVGSVSSVVRLLETYGLKVNVNKSFWTGRFRESCGGDYFAGRDVSIVKVRRVLPEQRGDVHELVSAIALRNLLWKRGYEKTVEFIDRMILRLGYPLPRTAEDSSSLGRWSFDYQVDGTDRDTHSPFVKVMVLDSKSPSDILEEEGALLKWFLTRGVLPLEDGHLRRAGRAKVARMKLGRRDPVI